MAAKFFTGLPLEGPDPECVKGNSVLGLEADRSAAPRPSGDHSHRMLPITPRQRPDRACDESPLAGFVPTS
jgi:hypothetical protein